MNILKRCLALTFILVSASSFAVEAGDSSAHSKIRTAEIYHLGWDVYVRGAQSADDVRTNFRTAVRTRTLSGPDPLMSHLNSMKCEVETQKSDTDVRFVADFFADGVLVETVVGDSEFIYLKGDRVCKYDEKFYSLLRFLDRKE